MQTDPHPQPREVCMQCRRPVTVCYCAHLPRIETRTKVLLLQHPRERDKAIGTARMASLCLPNSELHVGVDWQQSAALDRALEASKGKVALLYPGDDATNVSALPETELSTLIVVDGTWWQTRKMVRTNPKLSSLPRIAFTPERPSEYRIRKEPADECVSTIEALMYILGSLEGTPDKFKSMLKPFRAMVDAQIACRNELQGARIRKRKHPRVKISPIPACFTERPEDLVCVIGEANAWPYCCPERTHLYPDELIHWVAVRPYSGETFERICAPSHPLSVNTTKHTRLSEDELREGLPLSRALLDFEDFLRPNDILCSWGCYATTLFTKAGGRLPEVHFDLRQVCHAVEKRKLGNLEDWESTLPPTGLERVTLRGRAGQRVAKLCEIAREYMGPRPGLQVADFGDG